MKTTRTIVLMIVCTAAVLLAVQSASAMTLTTEQQIKLLAEAQNALDSAAGMEAAHPVTARDLYRQAAEKFQLLADSTDADGELYRRLADAQLHCGQIGKSIANTTRAEQLLGPQPRISAALAQARLLRDHDESALVLPQLTLMEKLALWNRTLSVPMRFWTGIAVWIGLWTLLCLSMFFTKPRAWRITAAAFGLVFVLLAGSLVWDLSPGWDRTQGVVTAPTAILRQGNGETFPAQMAAPLKDGTEFTLIERRGKWLQISLPDGTTGWLDESEAELLPSRYALWS